MSIQAVCDKCGATVDSAPDKEYRDIEIYLGNDPEPYFAAEDLCEACEKVVRNNIDTVIAKKLTRKRGQKTAAKGSEVAAKVPIETAPYNFTFEEIEDEDGAENE